MRQFVESLSHRLGLFSYNVEVSVLGDESVFFLLLRGDSIRNLANIITIIASAFIRCSSYIIGYYKFKEFVSIHTWMNK